MSGAAAPFVPAFSVSVRAFFRANLLLILHHQKETRIVTPDGQVAELAYAYGLGPYTARFVGSTPSVRRIESEGGSSAAGG